IRELYNDWMTNEIHELTLSERIKKPSYSLVFKTDNSEDDMIFNYDSLIVDKENKKNNELIGDNEFREEEFREKDYNNWDDINFANHSDSVSEPELEDSESEQ
ncbi:953_t:CDS:2, partial [Funneliformis caledonium]